MRSFGCIQSSLNGTELTLTRPYRLVLPDKYKLSDLGPVLDQGSEPICVSASLYQMVSYQLHYYNTSIKVRPSIFFDKDSSASSKGMQPKTAFELLINNYIPTLEGRFKVYAKVPNQLLLKDAIMQYGPVMIALPAKSFDDAFWRGSQLLGGHAVILVGWDSTGFILKNSWGLSYGYNGYSILPYTEFNLIYEAWTLIR